MGIMPDRFNSTSAPQVDAGPTTWGGGLRKDWPPEEGSIITCPSCKFRHGRRYMCDARLAVVEAAERRAEGRQV